MFFIDEEIMKLMIDFCQGYDLQKIKYYTIKNTLYLVIKVSLHRKHRVCVYKVPEGCICCNVSIKEDNAIFFLQLQKNVKIDYKHPLPRRTP